MHDFFFAGALVSAFPHPSGSVAFTPKNETALNAAFARANEAAWQRHLIEQFTVR